MKFPSKITSYSESTLCKLPVLLDCLSQRRYTVYSLYQETKSSFRSVEEYLDALDCLFALEKIRFLETEKVIYCVK